MKHLAFSLVLLTTFSIPLFSYAQVPDITALQQTLTVTTAPQYPKPQSTATIYIESYTYDLNAASIAWSIGGNVIAQGIGVKSVKIHTGNVGVTQTVSVSIVTADGKSFNKNITVTPTNLSFLTEALTYKPPLYEGKGVFTGQSAILVTAIPQVGSGAGIDPSNLIYKWTMDGQVDNNDSGYGKQTLATAGNYWGRDEVVMVDVSTLDGTTVAENSITLHPQSPYLLVYENNPLLGILYNHAQTSTFNLKADTEASFFAAPFGFIPALLPNKTTYTWSMNGIDANNGNGNTITFRNDSGQSGLSVVGLRAEQTGTNFENAQTNFSIQF